MTIPASISILLLLLTVLMTCATCAASDAAFLCSRCQAARFCSPDCQRAGWQVHKDACRASVIAGLRSVSLERVAELMKDTKNGLSRELCEELQMRFDSGDGPGIRRRAARTTIPRSLLGIVDARKSDADTCLAAISALVGILYDPEDARAAQVEFMRGSGIEILQRAASRNISNARVLAHIFDVYIHVNGESMLVGLPSWDSSLMLSHATTLFELAAAEGDPLVAGSATVAISEFMAPGGVISQANARAVEERGTLVPAAARLLSLKPGDPKVALAMCAVLCNAIVSDGLAHQAIKAGAVAALLEALRALPLQRACAVPVLGNIARFATRAISNLSVSAAGQVALRTSPALATLSTLLTGAFDAEAFMCASEAGLRVASTDLGREALLAAGALPALLAGLTKHWKLGEGLADCGCTMLRNLCRSPRGASASVVANEETASLMRAVVSRYNRGSAIAMRAASVATEVLELIARGNRT